jgi:hypothetical protein
MDRLTDDEMNQLKTLLIRYLAYHAEGIFNRAVDAMIARFKTTSPMIDVTPAPQVPAPKPPATRKR